MQLPITRTASGRRHSRLARFIVIALCSVTVISQVCCSSVGSAEQAAAKQAGPAVPQDSAAPQAAAVATVDAKQKEQPVEAKSAASEQAKPSESSAKLSETSSASEQSRKGRADAPQAASGENKSTTSSSAEPAKPSAASKPSVAEHKSSPSAATKPTASSSSSASSKQLSGKSGASSSSSGASSASKKLPANLGTVTSTGSGGPAHYMSKHDAYSAIAEKHGALAQDAMRKADKRNHNLGGRFGGIQKASGFTDALNPFKSVTDSGLARNIGASMRSIMKGKYSIPAYVASAVLGAVALMAFYESPISPLPVPALPEPPVGRFPPEMPVISPNLQVPFRMNGQQQQQQQQYGQQQYGQNGYANQRSFQTGPQQAQPQLQQQQSQVLFPGATAQQAQQRQGTAANPVQQLAANLISSVGVNRQTAQRKSGSDPDAASSSRSFFGSSAQLNTHNKLNAPANQHQQHKPGSGLLSFLGLGGGGPAQASGSTASGGANSGSSSLTASQTAPLAALGDVHRASGMSSHTMAAGTHDSAGGALSNSHLVNKMKSYFDRPVPHNSWSMDHNVPNHYDQYRRMSIMQALAKDTAFLSSFFTPSRRSSNSTSAGGAPSLQQSISAVLSSAGQLAMPSAATQQVASSRMQVDSLPALASLQFPGSLAPSAAANAQTQTTPAKRASSGYGLMRAADRVAHALLDTFTSGLLHRSSESASSKKTAAASLEEQQQQQNALASATSLLSDIMSTYNAAQQVSGELNNNAAVPNAATNQQQQPPALSPQLDGKQQASPAGGVNSADQTAGRNLESAAAADKLSPNEQQPKQAAPVGSNSEQLVQASPASQPLSRKVRSIGLDYPMEETIDRPQQPSRASQINNLVDLISDSYKQNKLLFGFVMNQVGLSQALPYVDQFLGNQPHESKEQHSFN